MREISEIVSSIAALVFTIVVIFSLCFAVILVGGIFVEFILTLFGISPLADVVIDNATDENVTDIDDISAVVESNNTTNTTNDRASYWNAKRAIWHERAVNRTQVGQ
ncbi:MAG: hypothetical protein WC346_05045 [Methanogenium sp.]|jgi:hypothetical protein